VRATLGTGAEVISGEEEAHLSFVGAVRGLPAGALPPYLVVDIGGGSSEFVRGSDERRVDASISVDIGCVRMTERHLHSDPPTAAEIEAARADITAHVTRAISAVDGAGVRTLIGLAGSVTTVAGIALGLPDYDARLIHHARVPYAQVATIAADLLAMDRAARLAIPVMHPGRADVIGAGALVLALTMAGIGAAEVIASEHDILDGIALSLA
jgi:exopolyphosphatase / guanosine-5'-triphosphate,3'-diphosphate pyrophosphatase